MVDLRSRLASAILLRKTAHYMTRSTVPNVICFLLQWIIVLLPSMAVGALSGQDMRFAENVALLSLLNTAPELPSRNTPTFALKQHDPRRKLSFETECDLTSGLAFLAGISDASEHVVALSIEEKPEGLKVLVAINKGSPSDGELILGMVKEGLQKVFNVLGKVDSGMSLVSCYVTAAMVLTQNRRR